MKGVGCRDVEQVALGVLVNIARMDDSAFKKVRIAQALHAAKKLNEPFVQPFDLFNGQKARFAH